MSKKISLTIALLTYNRVKYLKEALDAILAQTYTDFELLIMDNHSTDNTPNLVCSYSDKRVKYVRLPPGGNGHANFTNAMHMAQGEYILITHDDDKMKPNMIKTQIKFLEENDVIALSSNVSLINSRGEVIQDSLYNLSCDRTFTKIEYFSAYLDDKLWFPAPTTIYHKKTYFKVMGFTLDLNNIIYMPSADVLGMFLLNLEGKVAILKEPLLEYRQHDNQESRNVDQSKPHLELFENILKYTKNSERVLEYLPQIYAMYIKYKIQDELFNNLKTTKQILVKCNELYKYLRNYISMKDIKIDEIIIFDILSNSFGVNGILNINDIRYLNKNKINYGIQQYYRNWLELYLNNTTLLGNQSYNRIAILGSMLTAFMIVQDAKNNNIEVVNCLDSSIQRIGNNVLGVDIISLDNINDIENNIDAIILSSEREHDEALKKIIQDKLNNKDLPIISWKEMLS